LARTATYANISALMQLANGQTAPPLTNLTLYFALNDFNQDAFNSLEPT
jgi:hypothetical protein